MIVFSASEREASLCVEHAAVVANVALFYGDEIIRQKYRRLVLFLYLLQFYMTNFPHKILKIVKQKRSRSSALFISVNVSQST